MSGRTAVDLLVLQRPTCAEPAPHWTARRSEAAPAGRPCALQAGHRAAPRRQPAVARMPQAATAVPSWPCVGHGLSCPCSSSCLSSGPAHETALMCAFTMRAACRYGLGTNTMTEDQKSLLICETSCLLLYSSFVPLAGQPFCATCCPARWCLRSSSSVPLAVQSLCAGGGHGEASSCCTTIAAQQPWRPSCCVWSAQWQHVLVLCSGGCGPQRSLLVCRQRSNPWPLPLPWRWPLLTWPRNCAFPSADGSLAFFFVLFLRGYALP